MWGVLLSRGIPRACQGATTPSMRMGWWEKEEEDREEGEETEGGRCQRPQWVEWDGKVGMRGEMKRKQNKG